MTRLESGPPATYVLDAHTLYWYWTRPNRLGSGASSAFRRVEAGEATGLVPVIATMEIVYLTAKTPDPRSIETVLAQIDRSRALRTEPLTRQHT